MAFRQNLAILKSAKFWPFAAGQLKGPKIAASESRDFRRDRGGDVRRRLLAPPASTPLAKRRIWGSAATLKAVAPNSPPGSEIPTPSILGSASASEKALASKSTGGRRKSPSAISVSPE